MTAKKYKFIRPWNRYLPGDVIEPYSASFAEWLVIQKIVEPIKTRGRPRKVKD